MGREVVQSSKAQAYRDAELSVSVKETGGPSGNGYRDGVLPASWQQCAAVTVHLAGEQGGAEQGR